MPSLNNNFPGFDLLEVVPELEFHFKKAQPLSPLVSGDTAPNLRLQKDSGRYQQFFQGAQTHGFLSIPQLVNKPLVLTFYSRHWGEAGVEVLKQLNNIQHEVKGYGGNLLVVTAEEAGHLEKLIWDNSLTLNFYNDPAHELAQALKVYSDDDPAWNTYSGVDVNVPLLSTYVLSSAKLVVYAYIDRALSGHVPGREILTAVYNTVYENSKKSA